MRAARAERDRRIEDGVTAALTASDERAAADQRYQLAVEAARLAVLEAERVAERDRAVADEKIVEAITGLRADGVSIGEIAELLSLAPADVRRMARSSSRPAAPDPASAEPAVAAVVAAPAPTDDVADIAIPPGEDRAVSDESAASAASVPGAA
jgi:hypothetical protein